MCLWIDLITCVRLMLYIPDIEGWSNSVIILKHELTYFHWGTDVSVMLCHTIQHAMW